MSDENLREALEAIAAFPEMEKMYAYCAEKSVKFNDLLPPYLTMVRVAMAALGRLPDAAADSTIRSAAQSGLPLIEAAKNLLEACYQADAAEELSERIDGSLLDAVRDALIAQPVQPEGEREALLAILDMDADWETRENAMRRRLAAQPSTPGEHK